MNCKCNSLAIDKISLTSMINTEEYYVLSSCYFNDCITYEMREMLSVWMLEICEAENVLHDIYYVSMNLFDRLMFSLANSTSFNLDKSYIQLFGTCCMFLASKIRGNDQLDAERLVEYTDNSISLEQLLHCELFILEKLKWDTNCITPNDYYEYLIHQLNVCQHSQIDEIKKHFFALTALCSTNFKFSLYPPSMIASSCFLATLSHIKTVKIDFHNLLNHFAHIDYECMSLVQEQIESEFLSSQTCNSQQNQSHNQIKFQDDFDFDCDYNQSDDNDDSGYENSSIAFSSFLSVSPFNKLELFEDKMLEICPLISPLSH